MAMAFVPVCYLSDFRKTDILLVMLIPIVNIEAANLINLLTLIDSSLKSLELAH